MSKYFKVQSEFSVRSTTKNFLIDNHYKTIYGPARSECSSCRVYWVQNVRLKKCLTKVNTYCFVNFLISKKIWKVRKKSRQKCKNVYIYLSTKISALSHGYYWLFLLRYVHVKETFHCLIEWNVTIKPSNFWACYLSVVCTQDSASVIGMKI